VVRRKSAAWGGLRGTGRWAKGGEHNCVVGLPSLWRLGRGETRYMSPKDYSDTSEAEGAGGESSSMSSAASTAEPSEASSPSLDVPQRTEVAPDASGSPAAAVATDGRWIEVRVPGHGHFLSPSDVEPWH
jgi:hypothetical protein